MSRIVLAEPEAQLVERLRTAVADLGVECVSVETLNHAIDEIDARGADVLLVGPTLLDDSVFDLAQHLSEERRTAVVVTPAQFDASLLRRALRAGVTDVVAVSEPLPEITSAVQRALASAERIRSEEATAIEPDKPLAKVLTVFSTKGGVGKTVLATNLAVALAAQGAGRVAILDLDLEFGDVGIMLGIRPDHTIFDATQAFDRLDSEMLFGLMETHSSGVRALLAPVRPEDAEGISAARVGRIIDLVRENFDWVVIDTSPSFTEAVLAALDRTDTLYVITMMDVASIKNTRISLQKLRQLGYGEDRTRLVLNRSDSKVLLLPSEVEQAIGGRIAAHIPSDRLVPRCVNKGVPVVLDMPRSDVAKSIISIARDAVKLAEKEASSVS